MNTLSTQEKNNLKDIFKIISDDDINHIASAISKSSVYITCRKDAEDVILCMAPSIESIFGKRSLKKEYLLKYLWNHEVDVKTSDERTVLVREVFNLWNNANNPDQNNSNAGSSSSAVMSYPNSLCLTAGSICESDTLSRAKEFVLWFWAMFNDKSNEFGPQHFWNDSKLLMRIVDPQKESTEEYTGCETCASKFVSLRCAGYSVSPNLDIPSSPDSPCSHCGICAHKDSFGILYIKNRGTLYLNGELSGLYEIMFSLIRDVGIATANIFKIKDCLFSIKANSPMFALEST